MNYSTSYHNFNGKMSNMSNSNIREMQAAPIANGPLGNGGIADRSKISSDLDGMLHGIGDINNTINSGSVGAPPANNHHNSYTRNNMDDLNGQQEDNGADGQHRLLSAHNRHRRQLTMDQDDRR